MNIKALFSKLFGSKKEDWTVKSVTEAPTEIVDENKNNDIKEELNLIKFDEETLMLSKLDSEAETIKSYLGLLTKDIAKHNDFKHDKEKQDEAVRGIYTKIKQITIHGLELRNLLCSLEDHYFIPLSNIIKKLNERIAKADLENIHESLDRDLGIVKDLEDNISKIIIYDLLFNPDKNNKYKEAIETELTKKLINSEINDLNKLIINTVLDKNVSVKSRIIHNNIVEKLRAIL